MKRMGGWTMVVTGSLVALSGCRDTAMGPADTPDAGFVMAYADGGAYRADGLPSFDGNEVAPATFAVAFPDSIGGLVMAGFSQTNGTRGDLFILQVGDLRTGDFSPCDITHECHGRLLEDIDATNLQDVGNAWEFTAGTLQMDAAGPDRVAGSFTGLVMESLNGSATRTVENGTFDLPLLSSEGGADIMRCFLARVTGAPSCGS